MNHLLPKYLLILIGLVFFIQKTSAQSVELKAKNGYCLDSNYLYLNDSDASAKNWQKIEWYNSNNLIQTNIKTSSKTAEIVVGVPTNIGNSPTSFFYPESMYRDSSGAIYVVDTGNNRIQKWLPGATSGVTVAGGNGTGSSANQLNRPQGIFVDKAGYIYIADTGNDRIQKWAPGANQGVFVAYAYSPHSVFVDKNGNIYTDNGINGVFSIKKFAPGAPTEGKIVVGGISAGSGSNEFGSNGFIPFIYMDENDNLYVTDNGNHRIQKFAPGETNGVTIAGGNGAGSAQNQLIYPFGFFFDADKNLYIADSWNNRIQKWAPGAISGVTVAGGNGEGFAQNQFRFPQSIFVDNNELHVLDRNNCRVQKWTIGSLYGSTFAGSSNGTGAGSSDTLLQRPESIAKDSKGNLYVADLQNRRVQKFASGSTIGIKLSDFTFPVDIKVDRYDNVFVTDEACNCVLKFTPGSAQGIVVAGGNGQGSGANQLWGPAGIFIDRLDNLYVSDMVNHRIQKWAPGATSGVTVAGGNGWGSAANQFNRPQSLSVDSDLNLFIVDRDNNRIQKWLHGATSGSTVAGGNGRGSGANQFFMPTKIFIDKFDNLYIADSENCRIQKWAPGATFGVTVAGGIGWGSQLNQLVFPMGIFIDENNFLYISDALNNRILKLDQTQILDTTFKELTTGIFKAKVYDDLGNVFISNEIIIYPSPCSDFRISTKEETCVSSKNGSISINAKLPQSYTLTLVSSDGTTQLTGFDSQLTLNNLSGGDYSLCITIAGQPDYKQYFNVKVNKPQSLEVYSSISTNNQLKLFLNGGITYQVDLNGKMYTTNANQFDLTLRPGKNELTVSTDKNCQGIYSETFTVNDLSVVYPNPFTDEFTIKLPSNCLTSILTVKVFNSSGKLEFQSSEPNLNGYLKLKLGDLPTGIYMLNIENNTYKIVKK